MGRKSLGRRWLGPLALAVIVAAACGSTAPKPTQTSSDSTQNPKAPFGGTLNLGVWQEPNSFLDAGIVDSQTFSTLIDAPVAEGLLQYRSVDQTRNAKSLADYWQPWLATEVPTTENGDVKTKGCENTGAAMCVTWKLRPGVQWHDGTTFSSHDVCDTYNFWWVKYQGNNPTAILTSSGWNRVLDCKEKDPLTAVVNFKSVFGPYLSLGSGVYGVLPSFVLDKAFAAAGTAPGGGSLQVFKAPLDLTLGSHSPEAFKGAETLDLAIDGTGPYVFKQRVATKEVDLVRNQNYWNKAHLPHIDNLVFKFESSITAQVTAAKSGDIDMGYNYQLAYLPALLGAAPAGKLTVQTVPASGAEHIEFNTCANARGLCGPAAKNSPYTADPAIRRAILMGINRQQIIDDEAAHRSTIPRDAWQYLGIEYALDPVTNPQTAYSVEGANKILDDAGYKLNPNCDGGQTRAFKDNSCIAINLGTTLGNPTRVATESLVQADLAKIGIKVDKFAPNAPTGAFFGSFGEGGPLETHNFDMAMYATTASSPAEFDSYYPGYHADCGGTCGPQNQIPSAANQGQGQNTTGEANPAVDRALDQGQGSVKFADRTAAYRKVEQLLAQDLPDMPLYQYVVVNSTSVRLQGLLLNDIVWDYNSYDWYCTDARCQA
jgi:peptide/nickel transport system substrate-binding protein